MEIENKFLPIGTVVLLKGGKRELMITSYCIMPNGDVYDKNGKVDVTGQIFDYGACFYPEGMITSDQLFAFNHEQIEQSQRNTRNYFTNTGDTFNTTRNNRNGRSCIAFRFSLQKRIVLKNKKKWIIITYRCKESEEYLYLFFIESLHKVKVDKKE